MLSSAIFLALYIIIYFFNKVIKKERRREKKREKKKQQTKPHANRRRTHLHCRPPRFQPTHSQLSMRRRGGGGWRGNGPPSPRGGQDDTRGPREYRREPPIKSRPDRRTLRRKRKILLGTPGAKLIPPQLVIH